MCVLGVSAAFRLLSIGGPSGMAGCEVYSAGPRQSFKESKRSKPIFTIWRHFFFCLFHWVDIYSDGTKAMMG